MPDVRRASASVRRPRQVKVRIPQGVRDGQRIRVKGRGGAGANGGPDGDLYVRVQVEPHPLFGRDGDNLTVTVPITFAEAALGADVAVPTLEGEPVTIRVPAGTRSGRTFRVRGRGVSHPASRGRPPRHRRDRRAARSCPTPNVPPSRPSPPPAGNHPACAPARCDPMMGFLNPGAPTDVTGR